MKSAEEIINTIKELKLKNDKLAQCSYYFLKEAKKENNHKDKIFFKKIHREYADASMAYSMLLSEIGEETPYLCDTQEEEQA